jgi:peptidoglycan/xylan/chitin deacetylase (PgdA/CDA1 family)
MLRWLVKQGFELGDHTKDHIPLNTLDAAAVQREMVLGARIITDAVRGYHIVTMALPLGGMPKPASLARRGRWGGQTYELGGVFLAGAEPAPSPFSKAFDAGAIPRIRSSHLPWKGAADFTWEFWRHQLARNPERRYVSDGDPQRLTFPRSEQASLAPRFRPRARTY